MMSSAIVLDQLSTNESHKKKLFEAIASWLVDSNVANIELIGTNEQINVVKKTMIECKSFQAELSSKNATLESINNKLAEKLSAAQKFEKVFQTSWLL